MVFSALQEHVWTNGCPRFSTGQEFLNPSMPVVVCTSGDVDCCTCSSQRDSLTTLMLNLHVPSVPFFAFQDTLVFLFQTFFGTLAHGGSCDGLDSCTLPPFLCSYKLQSKDRTPTCSTCVQCLHSAYTQTFTKIFEGL